MCCHSTFVCGRGASPVRGFCLASLLDTPQGTCRFGWVANTSIFQSLDPLFNDTYPNWPGNFKRVKSLNRHFRWLANTPIFQKPGTPFSNLRHFHFPKVWDPLFQFKIISRADMGFKRIKSHNLERCTHSSFEQKPTHTYAHTHTRAKSFESSSIDSNLWLLRPDYNPTHTHIHTLTNTLKARQIIYTWEFFNQITTTNVRTYKHSNRQTTWAATHMCVCRNYGTFKHVLYINVRGSRCGCLI